MNTVPSPDAVIPTALGLKRLPVSAQLQAADAADDLLVAAFFEWWQGAGQLPTGRPRVLVLEDRFGAITTAIARAADVTYCTDSALSARAAQRNLEEIGTPAESVRWVRSLAAAAHGDTSPFDVVLWRLGREVPVLQQQRAELARIDSPGTLILAASMDKHTPPRVQEHLGAAGSVTMHPGRRKAHVFELDAAGLLGGPEPTGERQSEFGLSLDVPVGVYGTGQVDVGTRLLLQNLKLLPPAARIADLACGNGIIGIAAAQSQPSAEVVFFDDSAAAVAAARSNAEANLGLAHRGSVELDRCAFVHADGMHGYSGAAFNAILLNPPFHQHGVVTDGIAQQLFADAHAQLCADGALWVVGNRHLNYHVILRKWFGDVTVIGDHPKFVLLAASQPL